MAYVNSDVIVTPARLFYCPYSSTITDIPEASAVDAGGDWPAPWIEFGYTTEPINMATSLDVFEVEVQQSPTPIRQSITGQSITVTTSLAEFTAELMQLLYAADPTTAPAAIPSAPSTGDPAGHEVYGGLRTAPPVFTFGIEANYQTDTNEILPIRYRLNRGSITQNGDISFDKGAVAAVPVEIALLADRTQPAGQELFKLAIYNSVTP